MTTATLSSRGQIVIPSPIRKRMGFRTGDRFMFEVDSKTEKITLERIESFEELRDRITALIDPSIPPLANPRQFLNERPPRV